MSTERVATRVSDAEMERRWAAARRVMAEQGVEAIVAYHTEDWLGGHARWFTDIPTHNGYGRTVVFHADGLMTVVDQGNFGGRRELAGKDPYHRGVGEIVTTSFFSSVHYTTAYQGEIVREVFKKRGYRTIGFVVPGTMPSRLLESITRDFDGLKVVDLTEPIDRLIAVKSDEELDLMRECAPRWHGARAGCAAPRRASISAAPRRWASRRSWSAGISRTACCARATTSAS
jgi:Xaa-Pro aminopeptidase